MTQNGFLFCIHGHFYQPPRENPWLEEIETQESAAPYHDWNERIHHECYLPNSVARVFDAKGNIVNIANNFEKISFNFGPTLFSWMKAKHPEIHRNIVEADHVSREHHKGHGNAIAQAYNHMIMPLANRRDKVTQVRWGVADFRSRFGRDPESVWLPETACNEETLEVLVEEKVKFIILEPHQAEKFRALGSEEWADVSGGQIDPKRAYRCFLKNDPERFIDIIFYDGPISKAVAFEDLLSDSKRFMGRLESAKVHHYDGVQLINIATDGETFGHHKMWGDRVLAYLLFVEAQHRNYSFLNYGEFLEDHPPRFEVKLKDGENGEGTSWSCPHGVRRWRDHCGCRGDGPGEWTQHWRKPLREALDWLRDTLAALFEEYAGRYLRDVWEARNEYIEVILDRSEENVQRFFDRHARRPLEREEVILCLKLLEMQRHAMLMYTSCGWFFTELSGIETVQILQYAAYAVQLAQEATGHTVEPEFLDRLAKAHSNIARLKDGRGVYEQYVKPSAASLHHIVSLYGIGSIFENFFEPKDRLSVYCFDLEILHQRKEAYGNLTMNFGRVRIRSKITLEEREMVFVAVQIGHYDFRSSVKLFSDADEYEALEKELFDALYDLHILELMRKIDEKFGEVYDALKDLPMPDRVRIISILTRETIEKISTVYENLYEEHLRMNEIYRSINLPIPAEVRYAAEHTLEKRLKTAVRAIARQGFNLKRMTPITRIIEAAKSINVEIKKTEVAQFLREELEKRIKELSYQAYSELVVECLSIPRLAKRIGVELDLTEAQNDFFSMIRDWAVNPDLIPAAISKSGNHLLQLMSELYIYYEPFKKMMQQLIAASSGKEGV